MTHHWAVLALRDSNDPLAVRDVERDLLNRCSSAVCRFPAVKIGLLDRDNPLSAYVFVQMPASLDLEKSSFATRFLRDPLSRQLQLVTEFELCRMAPAVLLPPPGSTVQITAGDWSGLEGVVVAAADEFVTVLVELWSRQSVLRLAPNEYARV